MPLLAVVVLSAGEPPAALPKASGNAGKAGSYQVQCGQAGYSYWVNVPASPAGTHFGLHVFFHGQNGQGGAQHFGQWEDRLLKTYDLIGINMCYADGDNMKDTGGKVAAARAAVLQVMADYPVVPGRGMVACFSGGGLPCGQWYAEAARNRGPAWPFTALALYSANYRSGVQPLPETGWFVGVNQQEWTLAQLGATQTARFGEALAAIAKSGPDQRFLCLPGVGHSIDNRAVDAAAELFHRVDLAYAPFIHVPEGMPRQLLPIIAQANDGNLGAAATALAKLKPGAVPAEAVEDLQKRIDARAAAQVALITSLAANDLHLAAFYGNRFAKGLKSHAREAELTAAMAPVLKERKAAQAAAGALDAFAKLFPQVFVKDATIAAQAVPALEQMVKAAGERSNLGRMAADLLALPHAPAPGK
ncbi:MAG: hypothetical protein J0M02_02920 [Planctomycetes bacterium]|nr:hypothetical protein [Planctomycetota bacterium]